MVGHVISMDLEQPFLDILETWKASFQDLQVIRAVDSRAMPQDPHL